MQNVQYCPIQLHSISGCVSTSSLEIFTKEVERILKYRIISLKH